MTVISPSSSSGIKASRCQAFKIGLGTLLLGLNDQRDIAVERLVRGRLAPSVVRLGLLGLAIHLLESLEEPSERAD